MLFVILMSKRLCIYLPDDIYIDVQEFSNECCGGRISEAFRMLFRQRNKEHRLSENAFRGVIREENEAILNRLEQLRLAVGGAANTGEGCKCGARGCNDDQA